MRQVVSEWLLVVVHVVQDTCDQELKEGIQDESDYSSKDQGFSEVVLDTEEVKICLKAYPDQESQEHHAHADQLN